MNLDYSRHRLDSRMVDMQGSGAVEVLQLAIPLAKAVPLVGSTLEGSLLAVLYIFHVKDEVKMKKEKCQLLAHRVVTITAVITTELMKADPATLVRRQASVAALRGTLRGIQALMQELASASPIRRILKLGDAVDSLKLSLFHQQLNTAIDIFHITENMRTEDALTQLLGAIKEGENKGDILLINSLLRPVTTASYLARAPGSGCLTGTRKTLLDQISTWFYDDDPRVPQIFCLSGLGGTGKTAISHTVCEELHANDQLGASFFFSRDEADRRRVTSIIPSLAFQLASVNSTYRRKLCDILKTHPDAPSRAQQYQLKELLLDPLKKVPALPRYLIILDALDECNKERGKEGGDLIPLILRELPNSGLNIKVLITNRPERSIQDMFKAMDRGKKVHMTSVLHDIDQSFVKDDIASYLAYHLQRIQVNRNLTPPWPGDRAFGDLVTRAGLSFIIAATIVNFIADTYYDPQTQLQRLLASGNAQSRTIYAQVDLLYLQILRSSVEGRPDASESSSRFRKIVGAILLLQEPLSISSLAQLLEHDEADLEGALSPLRSVFDVPSNNDEPVRIFHPSFRDFLLVEERCQDKYFTVSEGLTHGQLALYCLKIMLRHLKRNICGISDDTVLNSEIPDLESKLRKYVPPALSYACRHWGDHLSQSTSDTYLQKELIERLSEFASTKILYWIEVLSLEGRFRLCIRELITVIQWCEVGAMELSVFHLIYDAYRLALGFHDVIDTSAMQVYHSALALIPNCALLHVYEHELPAVHMTSSRPHGWGASLLVLEGHRSSVNMVSFPREGCLAASASDDGHVRVWDTCDGGQLSCFDGHDGPVKSVEYSPDSSYIVSGGFDATIRIWDAVTGFNISTLIGHEGSINSAVFSSDGNNIASGSEDHTVRIWDVPGNRHLTSLNGHSAPVTCVAFLVDGSRILSSSMDSTIRLWDMRTNNTLKVIHYTDAVLSLAVSSSPQNSIFLSGSQNGVIVIRDVGTLDEIGHLEVGGLAAVKSVALSSQGNKVVSGSSDGIVRLWDLVSGSCVAEYSGHSGPVGCARFTPNGTCVLSSSADRTIRLWDATSVNGARDSHFPEHIASVLTNVGETVGDHKTTWGDVASEENHDQTDPRPVFSVQSFEPQVKGSSSDIIVTVGIPPEEPTETLYTTNARIPSVSSRSIRRLSFDSASFFDASPGDFLDGISEYRSSSSYKMFETSRGKEMNFRAGNEGNQGHSPPSGAVDTEWDRLSEISRETFETAQEPPRELLLALGLHFDPCQAPLPTVEELPLAEALAPGFTDVSINEDPSQEEERVAPGNPITNSKEISISPVYNISLIRDVSNVCIVGSHINFTTNIMHPSDDIRVGLHTLYLRSDPTALHNSYEQQKRIHQQMKAMRSWGSQLLLTSSSTLGEYPLSVPCIKTRDLEEVVKEVFTWLYSASSAHSIMWLYDEYEGQSRTALISQCLADFLGERRDLTASYFYSKRSSFCQAGTSGSKEDRTDDPSRIIPTIAYELTRRIPGIEITIALTAANNLCIFDLSLDEQMKNLIVDPLLAASSHKGNSLKFPQLFLIHGLEDCDDEDFQDLFLHAFGKSLFLLQQKVPQKLMLLGRQTVHLQRCFSRFEMQGIVRHRLLPVSQDAVV